jgi:uncharacterized RDD family membrane protein YckC
MQGSAERSVDCSVSEEMARQGLLATGTDGPQPYPAPYPEPYEASPSAHDSNPTLFDSSASLREAAAARVAAHRSRRAGTQAMEAAREEALRLEREQIERNARRGVSRVRDTVRARYENSQSYRDFLAAEAERATQHARAEAEVAARNARAIADAQLQLLEELRQHECIDDGHPEGSAEREARVPCISEASATPNFVLSTEPTSKARHPERRLAGPESNDPETARTTTTASTFFHHQSHTGDLFTEPDITEISTGGLTVRLYDDFGPALHSLPEITAPYAFAHDTALELEELEQEIAFRRAPEFTDHILGTHPLPANLIEFPRELVATRKARPRLAEGPLREDAAPEPQLRIFEVEAENISTEPATEETASAAPVWQGLLLDSPHLRPTLPPPTGNAGQLDDIAPIPRRLMAATVDACCVGAAFVAFATTVSYICGPRLQAMSQPGSRVPLAAAVFITLAISTLLYQLLFFSLNEATPGMRYAHIALCTFADANPTRRALRRRVFATVLAACPLGLGLLWAWLDDDRLGWHDRISRMYHRSY